MIRDYDERALLAEVKRAIRRKDEDLIFEYAKSVISDSIRFLAISALKKEEHMIHVVKTERNMLFRMKTIERISAEEVLADIALNDSSFFMRSKALSLIKSEEQLLKIAKISAEILAEEIPNEYGEIRKQISSTKPLVVSAAGRIKTEEFAFDVVMNGEEPSAAMAALKNVSGKEKLLTVALEHPEKEIRKEAVKRLPEEYAAVVLDSESDEEVISEALLKCTDEKRLCDAAINGKSKNIRISAMKNLRNKEILKRIFDEETGKLKLLAAEKLALISSDGDILLKAAELYGRDIFPDDTEKIRNDVIKKWCDAIDGNGEEGLFDIDLPEKLAVSAAGSIVKRLSGPEGFDGDETYAFLEKCKERSGKLVPYVLRELMKLVEKRPMESFSSRVREKLTDYAWYSEVELQTIKDKAEEFFRRCESGCIDAPAGKEAEAAEDVAYVLEVLYRERKDLRAGLDALKGYHLIKRPYTYMAEDGTETAEWGIALKMTIEKERFKTEIIEI